MTQLAAFVSPAAFLPSPALQPSPVRVGQDAGANAGMGAPSSLATALAGVAAVTTAASALSRGRQRVSAVAARAGPKILEGTGGPLPNDFWDPAGLAKGKSDEQLIRYREVELKHGRVCMLACLGWFHVAAGWHPIGDAAARVRVSDDPMISASQLPIGGAFQVVFTIMCLEWLTTYVCKPPENKPWDLIGWEPIIVEDKADWKENQLKELNNGRLAMMGFIGLVSQEALTGDYAGGVGKLCFGNPICNDWQSWDPFAPWPPSPYVQPSLTIF